jgi:hypothetical protein
MSNRIFIALGLLLVGLMRVGSQETPLAIENEFIRAVVNPGPAEAGRFSIRTTGGDPSRPSSQHKHLIFGGNTPWTSFTSVRVDDTSYLFGGPSDRRAGKGIPTGTQVQAPTRTDTGISCTYKFGDVEVAQELEFVRGASTRMLDTIGIRYRLTNTGPIPHQVGIRVMLDTMCGSNDGAPIRAGSHALTHAQLMTSADLPDYWQAFDDLSNPTVISQGSLRGAGATLPDAIFFADWGSLADEPWQLALTDAQSFVRKGEDEVDTAAALLWQSLTLDPGKVKTVTTHYGLGGVSLKAGQLALGLTAPAEATFAHERTEPFTITGYLQNTGGYEARNVSLTLALPAGVELADDKRPLTLQYAALGPGETVQGSWVVKPNGRQGGAVKLQLAAATANVEPNTLERGLSLIVPPPRLHSTPNTQSLPIDKQVALVAVNLSPATDFYAIRFTVRYDPAVIIPLRKPFTAFWGRAFVEANGTFYRMVIDDTAIEKGRLTITGQRSLDTAVPTNEPGAGTTLNQAESNMITIKFRMVDPGKSPLRFENAVLINENGDERPVEVVPGEVQILAPPPTR